jgi:hypothetical protein
VIDPVLLPVAEAIGATLEGKPTVRKTATRCILLHGWLGSLPDLGVGIATTNRPARRQ